MGRRNLHLLFPFILLFILLLIAAITFSYFQPEDLEDDKLIETFDLFFYSAYYFPESKSLGDNAIALVFTADFELTESYRQLEVRVSSRDQRRYVKADIQLITPHQKCKWIDYYSIVEGIPSVDNLAIRTGNYFAEIPVSIPKTAFHDVVTCIAPLYASEQWQVAILAAHVYRRFGSHMHLYVRSMVSPLFELMREYEKEGYLSLQPWFRVHLSSVPLEDLNPNLNVEFRNQAAAQTDCLLQYKETASFISFVDLDDILIPRLGGSYFDEFDKIFSHFPSSAYLFYGKENTRAVAGKASAVFSLSSLLHSIKFEQKSEMGKFVVQPRYINASWIHWPPSIPKGMRKHTVPSSVNAITHLKHIARGVDLQPPKELPLYLPDAHGEYEPKTLLSQTDLDVINRDFKRLMSQPTVKRLMSRMPEEFFYSSIISDCYREFYKLYYSGQLQRIKCFGPERCQFPASPDIPCYNANASYRSQEGFSLNIHFALSSQFQEEDGCIR